MPMDEIQVLIIDDDAETASLLTSAFSEAAVTAERVTDTFAAIEKLREKKYDAVLLDPMIRHRLNGYVVLNFIESEQPETLRRLFLLTGMSEQTIRRTAPSVLSRLFRKPSGTSKAAAAIIETCERQRLPPGVRRAGHSVLLVEDDQTTALATRELIEHMGYSVEHAQNGEEVCDALRQREFDVIMLDLVMPKIDGFAVIDHLGFSNPGLLKRVIVATGMPEKYIEALDRTAIGGFIRKPLDVSLLQTLLRHVAKRVIPFEGGCEYPAAS